MIDVSIIIVNYNTKELTRNCLNSIFSQTENISFEVIVSDNGSSDGSIEMIKSEFPQVILIENNENLGFGAANNRGLKIAKGKYIFFLNSDTISLNNAVKIFFDFWETSTEKDKIGALGCYLQKDGMTVHSFSSYPKFKNIFYTLFRDYISSVLGGLKAIIKKKKNFSNQSRCTETKKIDGYITGADLFVLNSSELHYDESFFMYFEESDLQFNLFFKNGLSAYILPEPEIIHFEGASDSSKNNKSIKYDFRKKSSIFYWISCIKYLRKNSQNVFLLFLLKIFVVFIWISPGNIKYTSPYIREFCKL